MRLFWIALTCLFSLTAVAKVPLTEALGNGPPIPGAPGARGLGRWVRHPWAEEEKQRQEAFD